MELFSPIVGLFVQFGSGMLAVTVFHAWQERKDNSFLEIISLVKFPLTLWAVCWGIGITELCIRFL